MFGFNLYWAKINFNILHHGNDDYCEIKKAILYELPFLIVPSTEDIINVEY
jgi:hypothetical protein